MGADQKRLSLLLPLVLFMAGCEALFASGGGEIPLPFHYSITVEVEEVIVEDGRITQIQVRELESSQNPGQVVNLDQSDAQEFNRHSPVCVGDQFELMHSIISDADGNYVSDHYSPQYRSHEAGCQAD